MADSWMDVTSEEHCLQLSPFAAEHCPLSQDTVEGNYDRSFNVDSLLAPFEKNFQANSPATLYSPLEEKSLPHFGYDTFDTDGYLEKGDYYPSYSSSESGGGDLAPPDCIDQAQPSWLVCHPLYGDPVEPIAVPSAPSPTAPLSSLPAEALAAPKEAPLTPSVHASAPLETEDHPFPPLLLDVDSSDLFTDLDHRLLQFINEGGLAEGGLAEGGLAEGGLADGDPFVNFDLTSVESPAVCPPGSDEMVGAEHKGETSFSLGTASDAASDAVSVGASEIGAASPRTGPVCLDVTGVPQPATVSLNTNSTVMRVPDLVETPRRSAMKRPAPTDPGTAAADVKIKAADVKIKARPTKRRYAKRTPVHSEEEKRLRKKEQNRASAQRYREKKRKDEEEFYKELEKEETENKRWEDREARARREYALYRDLGSAIGL